MKTAIKVLSILGIVFICLMLLIFFILTTSIEGLIQYSFEQGTLYNNGSVVTTQADLEMMKNIFKTMFIVIDVVLVALTVLPIISLVTANSDNNILHLILGIICCVSGVFIIIGILQILVYAGIDNDNKPNTIEVSQQ